MVAVYFDLDGTLLDSARCSVASTLSTFEKFHAPRPREQDIISRMGIPIEVSFREMSAGKINDDNWNDVAAYFRSEYKKNSDTHTVLYPGVDSFLKAIATPERYLFIVTSKKTEPADNNLTQLKIRHYFHEIIGSDKVDHYKPHPDPLYKARAFVPTTSKGEIMIGDADTDIIMGKAANMPTCAVTWGAHDRARLQKSNPDHIVDSIAELQRVISSL